MRWDLAYLGPDGSGSAPTLDPNLNRNGKGSSVACDNHIISRALPQDAGYTHAVIFSRGRT
jgi:hypothetical protein